MQAHLHFSGAYGHAHADLLSITLFSHGQERLSDIGYTWTHHRHWASCTLSHSTVMVNGEDQAHGSERNPSDGNLVLFVPGDGVFQVVEADGKRAYPGVVREFRRSLMVVGVSPEDAYVVDVFRVAGGERHEYVLVGDANHDGVVETELERSVYGKTLLPPGVKVQFPTGENVPGDAEGHNFVYGYVRDVEKAELSGPWQAVLTSEGIPGAAVRIHGVSESPGELLIGQAPSVRRAEEQEGRLKDFTMPLMAQRREGEDLESTFLHVLEPFQGSVFLQSVERMDVTAGDAMAVKVSWEGGTDYLVYASGGEPVQVGGITMEGRIGFVRERDGKVERMTLVGGTRLEKGQVVLESGGVISGQVVGVMRQDGGDPFDGLVVEGAVFDGLEVAGLTAVVKDGAGFSLGCTIAGIETVDGRVVIRLANDPGFEMDADGTSRHVYFPGRTWKGENRFEIATVSTRVF